MSTHKTTLGIAFLFAACLAACGFNELEGADFQGPHFGKSLKPASIDTEDPRQLAELSDALAHKRVLFLGEVHDRIEHHRNQLRIIKDLHASYPDLAIGVEYFQRPFQPYLDDYIAGRIDEREMLVKTEYFKRWKLDYRMLQPIFEFARQNHIPVVALNIPEEIHNKVFMGGLENLTPQERAQVPADMQPPSNSYLKRLRSIFDSHPAGTNFDNFVQGVLLWDESMSDAAARYLKAHPRSRMVVLAGMVHVMYGDGIPDRLNRRLGGDASVVAINGYDFADYPGVADFQLAAKDGASLPRTGKLGVSIIDGRYGIRIGEFSKDSAARSVGLSEGDLIVALNGIKVSNIMEVKSVMFDRKPGDVVQVSVLRDDSPAAAKQLQFDVVLR